MYHKKGPWTCICIFSLPFLVLLLLIIIREKKKQWQRRKVEMRHEHRGIYAREREHVTTGREEMIKDWYEHNLLRKEEGISRANNQSITGRPASPCYSTVTTLAKAHFLPPPFNTRPRVLHVVISGLTILISKTFLPSNYAANCRFSHIPRDRDCFAATAAVSCFSCGGLWRQKGSRGRKTATSIMKWRRRGEENKAVHNKRENRQSVSLLEC